MILLTSLLDEHKLSEWFSTASIWVLIIIMLVTVFVLTRGADWLVDGAVGLAQRTNLPKVVIGATILSLGTTAPEAFVSVMAAFMGNSGLALGNGIGSIVTDTGLIFGITAVMAAPAINKDVLNRTGIWQIGSALLLVVLSVTSFFLNSADPVITRWMGFLLVALLCFYLTSTYRWAVSSNMVDTKDSKEQDKEISLFVTLLMLIGGLFLVLLASRLIIPAASETARRVGVPDEVVAATLVAMGTSLPELVTAITAIRKGHPEITVGNIVGADVLNVLFVVGGAAIAAPLKIHTSFFLFHFPMLLFVLISFRIFISMGKNGFFKRWQGVWLLIVYAAYVSLQYVFF